MGFDSSIFSEILKVDLPLCRKCLRNFLNYEMSYMFNSQLINLQRILSRNQLGKLSEEPEKRIGKHNHKSYFMRNVVLFKCKENI